jgi:hypothetical protein
LETFEKCSIFFKFKEDENFNRRNTLSILRIKLKLHFVQNVESDTEIGQKGVFFKGVSWYLDAFMARYLSSCHE